MKCPRDDSLLVNRLDPSCLLCGWNAREAADRSKAAIDLEASQPPRLADATQPPEYQTRVTHCYRGHEYTPENTYWPRGSTSGRKCRACNVETQRRYRERRAADQREYNRGRRERANA